MSERKETLYSLGIDYSYLMDLMNDPEVDEDILLDTLEGVEGAFNDKIEAYAAVIKESSGDVNTLKEEEARLAKKRRVIENKIKRMKSFMMDTMNQIGVKKAGGTIFTVSIQKNGGKKPLELLVKPEDLPMHFQRVVIEADTDEIRAMLDINPDMLSDIAKYGEQGESIRIR